MKNNVFTAKNTFRDGMVSDLAPDNTQPNCLTSALNATFLTYNGNELSLQNDMGNARVHSAFLPEGYIPLGSTEFGGIIYVASYNPETNKCQIGSFPSPQRTTYSEQKSSTQTAINESDFISNEKMIATEKLYELTNFSLFPGDQFQLIGENIKNNKTNLYDFNNDKDGPLRLSVIIKNDLGEQEELEVSEKVFDDNRYIIPEKKTDLNNSSVLDLDYYRNLVNGFDTISSKISGKLYLKAELVVIDKFQVNITKYETVGPDLNITLELKSSSEKFEGIYAHQYKINDETIPNITEDGSLIYTLTIKDYKNLTTINFTIQPIMWGYVIPNLEITKSLNVKNIGTGEFEISQWRYWNDNNVSLYFGLEYYPEPNKEINDITISFIPYESLTDTSILEDVDEFGVNKHSEFNLHYDEVSNYVEEIEYNTQLKKDYLYLAEIAACESNIITHYNYEISESNKFTITGTKIDDISNSNDVPWKDAVEIELGESLEYIGQLAFVNCTKLKTITIPKNVKYIGKNAFSGCTELTTIEILGNNITFDKDAFVGCSSLESVKINNINDWLTHDFKSYTANPLHRGVNLIPEKSEGPNNYYVTLSDKDLDKKYAVLKNTLKDYVFFGCKNLTEAKLIVDTIGEQTFNNCLNLSLLEISGENDNYHSKNNCIIKDNTTIIAGCYKSTIPNSENVTTIGEWAFGHCIDLEDLEIPSNIKEIKDNAFFNCPNLKLVEVESKEPPILGKDVFKHHPENELIVPYNSDYSDWGSYFCNIKACLVGTNIYFIFENDQLKIYTEGNGDNRLPNFEGKTPWGDLIKETTEIFIQENVLNISKGAFDNKTFKSLTIEKTVETAILENCVIESLYIENADENLELTLTECSITNAVINRNLAGTPFKEMSSLKNIYICTSNVLADSFVGCVGLESVTISDPGVSVEIGENAFDLRNGGTYTGDILLTSINTDSLEFWCAIKFASSTSNPLIYGNNLYVSDKLVDKLIIPKDITKIGNYQFNGCSAKQIILYNNIESIGKKSFYSCQQIKTILIPDSVTMFGDEAFKSCTSLTSFTKTSNTTFSDEMFYGCNLIGRIIINGNTGTETFAENQNITSLLINGGSLVKDTFNSNNQITTVIFTGKCYTTNEGLPAHGLIDSGINTDKSVTICVPSDWIDDTGKFNDEISVLENHFKVIKGYTFVTDIDNKVSITGGIIEDRPSNGYGWDNFTISELYIDCVRIGKEAFYNGTENCKNITKITIGENVSEIGPGAFRDLMFNEDGTIKKGVDLYIDNIESWFNIIFEDVYSNPIRYAKSVYIKSPDGSYVPIKYYLIIPNNITQLNNYVFTDCTAFESIVVPENIQIIEEFAFKETGSEPIISNIIVYGNPEFTSLPSNSMLYYFTKDEHWKSVNNKIKLTSKCYFYLDYKEKTLYLKGNSYQHFYIKTSVNESMIEVGEYFLAPSYNRKTAFYEYENWITKVNADVKTIVEYNFHQYSNISELILSENVETIGANAFTGCSENLKVWCWAVNPPEITVTEENGSFDYPKGNKVIYVLNGKKDAYSTLEEEPYYTNYFTIKDTLSTRATAKKANALPKNCNTFKFKFDNSSENISYNVYNRFLYRWIYTSPIFNNEFAKSIDFNELNPKLTLVANLNCKELSKNSNVNQEYEIEEITSDLDLLYKKETHNYDQSIEPYLELLNNYNLFKIETNNDIEIDVSIQDSKITYSNLNIINGGSENINDDYKLKLQQYLNKNDTCEVSSSKNLYTFNYTTRNEYLATKSTKLIKVSKLVPLIYDDNTLKSYGIEISSSDEETPRYFKFLDNTMLCLGHSKIRQKHEGDLVTHNYLTISNLKFPDYDKIGYGYNTVTSENISRDFMYKYHTYNTFKQTISIRNDDGNEGTSIKLQYDGSDPLKKYNKFESTIFPILYSSIFGHWCSIGTNEFGIKYSNLAEPNKYFFIPPYYRLWVKNYSKENYNKLLIEDTEQSGAIQDSSDMHLTLSNYIPPLYQEYSYSWPPLNEQYPIRNFKWHFPKFCGIGMLDENDVIIPLNVFAYILAGNDLKDLKVFSRTTNNDLPYYIESPLNNTNLYKNTVNSIEYPTKGVNFVNILVSLLSQIYKLKDESYENEEGISNLIGYETFDKIFEHTFTTNISNLESESSQFVSLLNYPSINFPEYIMQNNIKPLVETKSNDIILKKYITVENDILDLIKTKVTNSKVRIYTNMVDDDKNDLILETTNQDISSNKLYYVDNYFENSSVQEVDHNFSFIDYLPELKSYESGLFKINKVKEEIYQQKNNIIKECRKNVLLLNYQSKDFNDIYNSNKLELIMSKSSNISDFYIMFTESSILEHPYKMWVDGYRNNNVITLSDKSILGGNIKKDSLNYDYESGKQSEISSNELFNTKLEIPCACTLKFCGIYKNETIEYEFNSETGDIYIPCGYQLKEITINSELDSKSYSYENVNLSEKQISEDETWKNYYTFNIGEKEFKVYIKNGFLTQLDYKLLSETQSDLENVEESTVEEYSKCCMFDTSFTAEIEYTSKNAEELSGEVYETFQSKILSQNFTENVSNITINLNNILIVRSDNFNKSISNNTDYISLDLYIDQKLPKVNGIGKYLKLNDRGLLCLRDMSQYKEDMYLLQGSTNSNDSSAGLWTYLQDLKLRNEYAV